MIGVRTRVSLALLLTFCLAATTSSAQGFNALYSRDGLDVWAVGPAGVVYRSMNAGGTWSSSTLGATSLNGVAARGLTVMVVSDGGTLYRSTNAGGAWTSQVLTGSPDLKAIAMPTDLVGYAVGSGGAILRTDDGGANWSPQTSGTAQTLNAVAFVDANTGYAVGATGTILKTEDGGSIWTPLTSGTTRDLLDVAASGSTVWAVGRRATALVSPDGGMNWTPQNLKMDSHGDVRAVSINALGHVTLAGGGGFVRTTTDGGATWAFHSHKMLAPITDIFYFDNNRAFFANSANRCVMNTANNGSTWNFPTGTTPSYVWNQKLATGATVRGDGLHQNGQNPNSFYVVLGSGLYKSPDRGETWSQIGTIPGVSKTNAFYVHPADSMMMVAAVGTTDRIVRSTNGGATWTATINVAFTEYGMPLEMDPDNNNHLLFMPEDGKVYQSFDFGATWTVLSSPGFRSPCDIIITPDQTNLILVGDGVTGSGLGEIWKSTDSGLTFTKKFTRTGSEVPMMAISRLNTSTILATQWGSGGVQASKNYGDTWPSYHPAGSAWGCDFADDDPNVAIHGQYSGGNAYLTTDLGVTFTTITPLNNSNYAFSVPDRATFIAQQGGGVYKLAVTYPVAVNNAQNLIVQIPNGGNTATAGQNFMVRWFSQNVALASLEYQKSPIDPWVPIATLLDSYRGEYNWLVPNDPTTTAKVRVIDLWDGAPIDESNTPFTIVGFPALTLSAPGGGESWQNASSHDIDWSTVLVNNVAIEYRTSEAGPWIPIETTWPAANHPYPWTVPNAPTAEARIRVRDLSGTPADSSDLFSIIVPDLTGLPAGLDFGMVEANTTGSQVLRLDNTGTAPLSISNIASDNAHFVLSRTSLVIAAADTDTVTVTFTPDIAGVENGVLTIDSDDPDSPSSTLNLTGEGTATVGAPEAAPKPTVYVLRQNRPNPFTGTTRIEYALPSAGRVRLDVFDMAGRRVATLVDQEQEAGFYSVDFGPNARTATGSVGNLSSGVYFYRIQPGSFTRTQRMLLLR